MKTYPKTDTFDIETGMTVFDVQGNDVGTVTDIVGFGGTRIDDASTSDGRITQASSGTGHFGVHRADINGVRVEELRLSFSDINKVVAGKGVVLTAAAITQPKGPDAHSLSAETASTSTAAGQPRKWQFWRKRSS